MEHIQQENMFIIYHLVKKNNREYDDDLSGANKITFMYLFAYAEK